MLVLRKLLRRNVKVAKRCECLSPNSHASWCPKCTELKKEGRTTKKTR